MVQEEYSEAENTLITITTKYKDDSDEVDSKSKTFIYFLARVVLPIPPNPAIIQVIYYSPYFQV